MREHEIEKIYSMLDNDVTKNIHEYRLKITHRGINVYPKNDFNTIYVINSLIDKVLKINFRASFFINFKEGYLRIH